MGRIFLLGILLISQWSLFITESLAGSVMRAECEGAVRALDSSAGLTFSTGYCAGFLRGTFDAITSNTQAKSNSNSGYKVCSPETAVTTAQLIRVYMKYINQHPQTRQERTHAVALKAFQSEWPCTKSLEFDSRVFLMQSYLKKLGYQIGAIDGILGDKTRGAIKRFQEQNSLPVTGEITSELERIIEDTYYRTAEH